MFKARNYGGIKFMKMWKLGLLLLCMPWVVNAIEPFSGAQVQHEQHQQVSSYRLVLSGLARVQAHTVPDHEVRLQGDLWRRAWAVDSQFSLAEVSEHYAAQLDGLRTLYECRALDCGSNNFWANNIFNNARLVGRDKFQYYRVALQQENNQSTLYVLYVIERGTKQIMVNLDVLSSPQRFNLGLDAAGYIRQQLKSNSGWLAGFNTENNQLHPERSAQLLAALKQLSAPNKSKLYLIVHCYNSKDMAITQQCSENLAKQLQESLGKDFNVEAQGALALAPEGQQPALRFVYWPTR